REPRAAQQHDRPPGRSSIARAVCHPHGSDGAWRGMKPNPESPRPIRDSMPNRSPPPRMPCTHRPGLTRPIRSTPGYRFNVAPLLLPPLLMNDASNELLRSTNTPTSGSSVAVFAFVRGSITGLSDGSKPPDAVSQYSLPTRREIPIRNALPAVVITFH